MSRRYNNDTPCHKINPRENMWIPPTITLMKSPSSLQFDFPVKRLAKAQKSTMIHRRDIVYSTCKRIHKPKEMCSTKNLLFQYSRAPKVSYTMGGLLLI
jgi:hypothetical protein